MFHFRRLLPVQSRLEIFRSLVEDHLGRDEGLGLSWMFCLLMKVKSFQQMAKTHPLTVSTCNVTGRPSVASEAKSDMT